MSQHTPAWTRILMLLAAVVGAVMTSSLGLWQLGRAAEKLTLQDARTHQAALAPIDGQTLGMSQDTAFNRQGLLYRRIDLKGRWIGDKTVYLENRQMHGRPGFFVMTPLKLTQTGTVLLVQRGWAARSFTERSALPVVQTPSGEVAVSGNLAPWPSRLYDFGGIEDGPIRQNLDLQHYQEQTGLQLLEVSVQQTGPESEGLLREWPVVSSGVEKHYGYAFQWFGLSALIALLYVWFQIVQPRRKKTTI